MLVHEVDRLQGRTGWDLDVVVSTVTPATQGGLHCRYTPVDRHVTRHTLLASQGHPSNCLCEANELSVVDFRTRRQAHWVCASCETSFRAAFVVPHYGRSYTYGLWCSRGRGRSVTVFN